MNTTAEEAKMINRILELLGLKIPKPKVVEVTLLEAIAIEHLGILCFLRIIE